MRKNILNLNSYNVRQFFLKQDIYINIDLPPYYKFETTLIQISENMGWKSLSEAVLNSAKNVDKVNHVIFGNKDGNYAWRKYELINPILYISLVNTICNRDAWEIILNRFKELDCGKSIKCASIPVLADSNQKQKASQINEWIDSMERESIKRALDFEYLFQTDIVSCYPSIYTHSVAWALHGKSISKEKRKYKELLGNRIDRHLQAMSYGQTNGIPQGSVLMDFIAEIVLAYADRELFEKIKGRIKEDDYHILRFRDDYRIFVRDPKDGDLIMKVLTEVLAQLGMSLHTLKTKKSEKIILESIKKDKMTMIKQPLSCKINQITLRNELLTIYELGTIYPNCGSISSRLMKINDVVETKIIQKNYEEMVSILINIAYENPRSFPIVAALISKAIDKQSKINKEKIFSKLLRKINLLPNSGLMEIWLQRITIKHNIQFFYEEKLCRNTNGENLEIFNTNWIESVDLKQILDDAKFIDYTVIKLLDTIISRKEVELFALRPY